MVNSTGFCFFGCLFLHAVQLNFLKQVLNKLIDTTFVIHWRSTFAKTLKKQILRQISAEYVQYILCSTSPKFSAVIEKYFSRKEIKNFAFSLTCMNSLVDFHIFCPCKPLPAKTAAKRFLTGVSSTMIIQLVTCFKRMLPRASFPPAKVLLLRGSIIHMIFKQVLGEVINGVKLPSANIIFLLWYHPLTLHRPITHRWAQSTDWA